MTVEHAFPAAAAVALWLALAPSVRAQDAPGRRPLAIPVVASGGKSVECVVSCGPTLAISAVAFSPDGNTLAVGGYQEVLLWDLAGAKLARRLGAGQLQGAVRALAFCEEGKTLAVGHGEPGVSGSVKLFDLAAGNVAHTFDEPADAVLSLELSPDGKLLAGSGAYQAVHVWSLADKKLAHTIEDHSDWVLDVSFNSDGTLLATAGADRTLKIWKVEDWSRVLELTEKEPIRGAAFAKDSNILVVAVGGPTDRGVKQRRMNNVRYKRNFWMPGCAPLAVLGEPEKNRVHVPCSDNTVKTFDGNGRTLATMTGHEDWVYSVSLSPDGAKLASGSGDGTVRLWNAADGKPLATLVQLAPGPDEWLIVTAPGYLATSSAGALAWNTSNVKTPKDQIAGILANPELAAKAIAGEKTEPPALE